MKSLVWDTYQDHWRCGDNLGKALFLVGAEADSVVERQYKYLLGEGLKPYHKFLDIGCGCLRGTIKVLDYLDDGNFFGLDVSESLLRNAFQRITQFETAKQPHLKANKDFDINKYFPDERFDFIFAVSLITHLHPNDVEGLFKGISEVLQKDGVFYFTCYPLEESEPDFFKGDVGCTWYKKSWLIDAGKRNGLSIKDIPGDLKNEARSQNVIKKVNTNLGQWVMRGTL